MLGRALNRYTTQEVPVKGSTWLHLEDLALLVRLRPPWPLAASRCDRYCPQPIQDEPEEEAEAEEEIQDNLQVED